MFICCVSVETKGCDGIAASPHISKFILRREDYGILYILLYSVYSIIIIILVQDQMEAHKKGSESQS